MLFGVLSASASAASAVSAAAATTGAAVSAPTTATASPPRYTAAMAAAAGRFMGGTVTIPPAAPADTFTVDTTSDLPDAAPGDGVCRTSANTCSFRAALTEANKRAKHAGINFGILGSGVQTINIATKLPYLTNPAGMTIDGYTQPGAVPNTDPLVSNAQIMIQVVGAGYNKFPGLIFTNSSTKVSAFNEVRGLSIYSFSRSIWMLGGSHDNLVVGNFVCTDAGGTALSPTQIPGNSGVHIQGGAHDIVVGTPALSDRNVISGCPHHGVATYEYPTTRITIQNNIVGLNPSGTGRLPNRSHGVDVNTFTTDSITGGYNAGEGNLISGNGQEGAEISHGTGTLRNDIIGNNIGTDKFGNAAPKLNNIQFNVRLEGAATCPSACPDAGDSLVANNIIVGSALGGVHVDKGRHDDVIRDNKIGVDASGAAGPNQNYGVRIEHYAMHTTLGPGNEIANNDNGVQIESAGSQPAAGPLPTNFNTVTQNSIHDNAGRGIDLSPRNTDNTAANADPYTNEAVLAPSLSATPVSVTAATCANCTVELFVADTTSTTTRGEGKTYLASAVADSNGSATFSSPAVPGTVVTATATTPAGSTSEFSQNVKTPTAATGNTAPTAVFTSACTALTCTFDGSASSDPDPGDGISRYRWTFGDGSTGTGVTPSHTYANAATYSVTLVVTDKNGADSAPATGTVSPSGQLTASFTKTCTGYDCSFDGSGSSPSGTITGYSWDFGDGTTGSGQQVSHTYAVAGHYPVKLTVTDGTATATATGDATPMPPAYDPVLATDTFNRAAATGGFGTADRGGAWKVNGTSANFALTGTAGTIRLAAGVSNSAVLPSVSSDDTDISAEVSTASTPQAFGQTFALIGRRSSTNNEYRLRVRFSGNAGNPVLLAVTKLNGSSSESLIGPEVRVTGLNWSADTSYRLHFQVVGTNPTALRGNVWPAGSSEPSGWVINTTDGSIGLQAAGTVGVQAYVASATTNGPVTFTVDNLDAHRTNQAPNASFTANCTGLLCSFDGSASSDPEDGASLTYDWSFGDGATASGNPTSHAYTAGGTYTVTLTVTDSKGVATAFDADVTVS